MTIPKTYTLRQLRELRSKGINFRTIYVDLFLNKLEKREIEEKGIKMPGLRIDPGRPFVSKEAKKKKKTSSLFYPITVLESERDNSLYLSVGLIDQLNKAIEILDDQRSKIKEDKFKVKVEKKKEKHQYFNKHELIDKK